MSSQKIKLTKQQALEELARRRGLLDTPGIFPIRKYLFDKQLSFVLDMARFKVAVTTRRAGKTISCVADLTNTALQHTNCVVLYITKSRINAKRLVWPEFKRLNDRYKLGGDVNEADLSIKYPNGSFLYLLGASDRTSIEDFRGLAIKKVYLDESQSFPSYIGDLVDDVLSPALMDHNGQLILIGTPGPVPSGYFYDITKNPAWSHHAWSFFDNPKLPFLANMTHKDALDQELKRRGVSVNDPSIQREWFGHWVVDEDSLVYHYNAPKNDYKALPLQSWTYILGVDLGYEDADALALIAYSEGCRETYLVEEVVTKHQDLSSLCNQIDILKDKYGITKIVVDTGGLGKKITEEISKRYTIPMVAAEKSRKTEYIELMNDDLRTGRLKIKANTQFAYDAQKVEWDWDKTTPDRKVISSKFHSDICEAVLYAWRESYSYTHKPAQVDPEFGTYEWSTKEAEDMFQATLTRMEEEKAANNPDEPFEPEVGKIQKLDRPRIRYQDRFDARLSKNPFGQKPPTPGNSQTIGQTVYLLVGSPGSGKSWVCSQLGNKFNHIAHDAFIGREDSSYLTAIKEACKSGTPILAETPFSISKIKEPLEARGIKVIPVFIIESERVLSERYAQREGKEIPQGHLTRQDTYKQRAIEYKAFSGTSSEVLEHLKKL